MTEKIMNLGYINIRQLFKLVLYDYTIFGFHIRAIFIINIFFLILAISSA